MMNDDFTNQISYIKLRNWLFFFLNKLISKKTNTPFLFSWNDIKQSPSPISLDSSEDLDDPLTLSRFLLGTWGVWLKMIET